MTFLSPGFLFAVSGATVPVIIHLLARRARLAKPFSSLLFLREIEQTALRWLKVHQRRLLMLRILILVATAVALARPTCGSGPGDVLTLVVVDRSASMGAREGAVWRKAVEQASRFMAAMPRTRWGLATAGDGITMLASLGSPPEDALLRLENVGPGSGALNVPLMLTRVASWARSQGEDFVRMILVSDFQPGNWTEALAIPEEMELWGVPVDGTPTNIGLGQTKVTGVVGGESGSIRLEAVVARYGEGNREPNVVTLRWEGLLREIDVPAGERVSHLDLNLGRTRPGLLRGELVVHDPQGIVVDNKCVFAVDVPRTRRVLVIGTEGEEMRRVMLALDPFRDGASGFLVAYGTRRELESARLESLDSLVLVGGDLTGACARKILAAWEHGLGVVVIATHPSMNAAWAGLYLPLFGALPGDPPVMGPGGEGWGEGSVEFDHPLLSEFRGLGGFPFPMVWRVRTWDFAAGYPLISLPNGYPLLVENDSREGAGSLLWLTGLTPPWSDWSGRSSFVPLFRLAVAYVCGIRSPEELVLGEEKNVELPCDDCGCSYFLEMPDGSKLSLYPETISPGRMTVRLGPVHDPDLYIIRRGNEVVALYQGVVAECERGPSFPSARPAGVTRWLGESGDLESISSGRFEATSLLLLLVVVLVLTETELATRLSAGPPPKRGRIDLAGESHDGYLGRL